MLAAFAVAATLLLPSEAPVTTPPSFDNDVSALLGRVMPEWELERWLDGRPRTLASLRGKVVLIRWFAMPTCPFCTRSAETLNNLDDAFSGRGLEVIGIYHHKEDRPPRPDDAEVAASAFGFHFPVAVDRDFRTLNPWWLDGHEGREYTSVTFLLDRSGRVRYVHPGGTLAEGPALDALCDAIEAALAEGP